MPSFGLVEKKYRAVLNLLSCKYLFSIYYIQFLGVSEEYTKKKEEQMEQKKHRRLTAKQAQRHKDNELWEKNRMFRSGAVLR